MLHGPRISLCLPETFLRLPPFTPLVPGLDWNWKCLSGQVPWAWVGAVMYQSLYGSLQPSTLCISGSNDPKSSRTCACGVILGPGAGLKQPGECINSADRHSIEVIGWYEIGLLEWCWHSDFEWFSLTWIWNEFRTLSSHQPTANPWVWLHVRSPESSLTHHIPNMVMTLGHSTQSGMWKLPPPLCCWHPGQSTHPSAGSALQGIQSWVGAGEGSPAYLLQRFSRLLL